MYDCDDAHNIILEKIFSSEVLNCYEFISEGEVESSDDEIEYNETYFFHMICLSLLNN